MPEISSAKVIPVRKRIADGLTASRLVIAVAVMMIGILTGRDGLNLILALVLVGWTTDVLDGQLARSVEKPIQTWIGDNDLAVDLVLDLAALFYFIAFGFVPVIMSLVYLLIACVVVSFSPTKRTILFLEIPVLMAIPIVAFSRVNVVSIVYAVWLLAVLVYNWGRLWGIIGFMLNKDDGG